MISDLALTQQFHDVIHTERLVLIDFYTTWCEPCKWLDTILVDVDKRISIPVLFLKIDAEKHPELANQYQVKSAPVLILLVEKVLVWRLNGFLTADELIVKLTDISRGTPK